MINFNLFFHNPHDNVVQYLIVYIISLFIMHRSCQKDENFTTKILNLNTKLY